MKHTLPEGSPQTWVGACVKQTWDGLARSELGVVAWAAQGNGASTGGASPKVAGPNGASPNVGIREYPERQILARRDENSAERSRVLKSSGLRVGAETFRPQLGAVVRTVAVDGHSRGVAGAGLRVEARVFTRVVDATDEPGIGHLSADARVFAPSQRWCKGAGGQLGDEDDDARDEVAGLAGLRQEWQKTKAGRAKMRMVCEELFWYHGQAGKTLEPSEVPELVDDAEAVKGAMAQLMPWGKLGWKGVLSKSAAFWNRISLHHSVQCCPKRRRRQLAQVFVTYFSRATFGLSVEVQLLV